MDIFTISFWRQSISKDDSAVEPHDLHEAGLVHATVTRTAHEDGTRYAIELEHNKLNARYGRVVLSKNAAGKWKVVSALDGIEDIFVQLTDAIDAAEATAGNS